MSSLPKGIWFQINHYDKSSNKTHTCLILTNVKSDMCVSQNFRFISEFMFWEFKHFQCLKEYVSVQMYLKVNYLARREKDEIKSCIAGESGDDSCAFSISHAGRKVWSSFHAIPILTVHLYRVTVTEHSMSLMNIETDKRT